MDISDEILEGAIFDNFQPLLTEIEKNKEQKEKEDSE